MHMKLHKTPDLSLEIHIDIHTVVKYVFIRLLEEWMNFSILRHLNLWKGKISKAIIPLHIPIRCDIDFSNMSVTF